MFDAVNSTHGASKFTGSPLSKGVFQFDHWNVTPSDMWDWDALRQDIIKYGGAIH